MVEYHDLAQPTLIARLVYFSSSLGHVAVMVFFVMSGFFVGGSIIAKSHDFHWSDYFVTRLSRLWVVLIPALGLTLIVDCYLMPTDYVALQKNMEAHSISTLLGNVFFLQNVFVTEYGSNQPLWSLANEFWYYIIFPLAFFSIGNIPKKSYGLRRVAAGLAATIIFLVMPSPMRLGLLIWLMGVAVYFFSRKKSEYYGKQQQVVTLLVSLAVFIVTIIYNKLGPSLETGEINYRDVLVGAGFSLFLYSISTLKAPSTLPQIFIRISRGLSEVSYSLYLSHLPIAMLIGETLYGRSRLVPSISAYMQLFLLLLVLVMFSVLFWWLFERHTFKLRKCVISLIKARRD